MHPNRGITLLKEHDQRAEKENIKEKFKMSK